MGNTEGKELYFVCVCELCVCICGLGLNLNKNLDHWRSGSRGKIYGNGKKRRDKNTYES